MDPLTGRAPGNIEHTVREHRSQTGAFTFRPANSPPGCKSCEFASRRTVACGPARRVPQDVALVMGDAQWTWAQFEARTDALALALQDMGLDKGDRVLCQSQNCMEMMQAMFAVWRAGGVWVPANYRQTPEELVYLTESSGARFMICNARFPDHAAACAGAAARCAGTACSE